MARGVESAQCAQRLTCTDESDTLPTFAVSLATGGCADGLARISIARSYTVLNDIKPFDYFFTCGCFRATCSSAQQVVLQSEALLILTGWVVLLVVVSSRVSCASALPRSSVECRSRITTPVNHGVRFMFLMAPSFHTLSVGLLCATLQLWSLRCVRPSVHHEPTKKHKNSEEPGMFRAADGLCAHDASLPGKRGLPCLRCRYFSHCVRFSLSLLVGRAMQDRTSFFTDK